MPQDSDTWESRGYRDGLAGIQPTHPKHDVYMRGWNIGHEQHTKKANDDPVYLDAHALRHREEP